MDVNSKLKQLKIEDYIWGIYSIIIFLSWFSNSLERKYFLYKDEVSKKKYQEVMILIFTILVIVYFYFFKDSYKDFQNLKPTDSEKKRVLVSLSFLASFLIIVSGIIFLFIALEDENLDVELAFN